MGRRHFPAVEIDELVGLDRPALLELWHTFFGRPAPAYAKSEFLVRAIAWEAQSHQLGGLPPAVARRLGKIAAGEAMLSAAAGSGHRIKPGACLIRTWHGLTHEVHVLDDGYAWKGKRYTSLSAIAREITGTRWNGRRFFGLSARARGGKGDG